MQLIVISQCEFQLNPRVFLEHLHLRRTPGMFSAQNIHFLAPDSNIWFLTNANVVSNGWGGLAAGSWQGHSMISLIYVVSTSVNFGHLLHLGIAFKLDLASFYA